MIPTAREREGVKEAYNLFNEVADQLFGPEDLQQASGEEAAAPVEDSGDEVEDIDAAFDKVSCTST
jgi:hypothetical protein